MKKYEIYTENKNLLVIETVVGASFSGFTIQQTTGYWKGRQEPSLIITIITEDVDAIQSTAEAICAFNAQESVLVVSTPVLVEFVEGRIPS